MGSSSGTSIPPEHRGRVFGLFKRLHSSADYPGSAMGLTLCTHVATQHGGTITIEGWPEPGVGTTLVVALHETGLSLTAAGAVPAVEHRIDTAA